MDDDGLRHKLTDLVDRLTASRATNIGFPAATDVDYSAILTLTGVGIPLLNNMGDPWEDGVFPQHTKPFERAVITRLADMFRAPAGDRWGYVTSGATEGTQYALRAAKALLPTGLVYHSAAAHPSVTKTADALGLPTVAIRVDRDDQINVDDFAGQLDQHRDRPAIVVATAGTTMTEAVDDLRQLMAALDDLAITRRFIHVDAALSGIPLAMIDPASRPGFDFADGADSLVVSGHKFLGVPFPCGVVLTRATIHARMARPGGYTGSPDGTVTGSRNGWAALLLWYVLASHDDDRLRERAAAARERARYAQARLIEVGGDPVFRHPLGFTVTIPQPPPSVLARWPLPHDGRRAHVVCMPGVSVEQIDAFAATMRTALQVPDVVSLAALDSVRVPRVPLATGWWRGIRKDPAGTRADPPTRQKARR